LLLVYRLAIVFVKIKALCLVEYPYAFILNRSILDDRVFDLLVCVTVFPEVLRHLR